MRRSLVEPKRSHRQDAQSQVVPLLTLQTIVQPATTSVELGCEGPDRRAKIRSRIQSLETILRESPDFHVSLARVAAVLNLERTYCCRVIREITGKTFTDWIRKIRIERARILLLQEKSITEVSFAVGYTDLTTFGRNFRREFGMSPRAFRQLMIDPCKGR